jgi:hypothetical protein
VVVVDVIVFMLVVHGRWCIVFIFIEVEASKAGFEMAMFFPFKGSKGWRFEVLISPTHKRTEGRAPVWGSEFTSKRRRTTGGDSAETAVG